MPTCKNREKTRLVAMPEGGLWTADQVAAYLGLSKAFVWKQVRQNLGLPYVRLGGVLRFDPAAVRAWVAMQSSCGQEG